MEHSFFSLIYKTKERKDLLSFHALGEVIKQLDAQWLLHAPKTDWLTYITDDIDTIRYREEAFADIARHPALAALCAQCAEKLDAIDALRRIKEGQQTNETMLYSIKEVELYLDLTALLKDALDPLAKDLNSDSFKGLYALVKEECESEEYCALKEGVSKLSRKISGIRSLTVGINLDANLTPYESGILSINEEYFHAGDLISRFMRLEEKNEMTTLAPLYITSKSFTPREAQALNISVNEALKKIVSSGLRGWQACSKSILP